MTGPPHHRWLDRVDPGAEGILARARDLVAYGWAQGAEARDEPDGNVVAGAELANDDEPVRAADDLLDLRDVVAVSDEEAARIAANGLVLAGRQDDRLGAVRALALAHELRRCGPPLRDLDDPL